MSRGPKRELLHGRSHRQARSRAAAPTCGHDGRWQATQAAPEPADGGARALKDAVVVHRRHAHNKHAGREEDRVVGQDAEALVDGQARGRNHGKVLGVGEGGAWGAAGGGGEGRKARLGKDVITMTRTEASSCILPQRTEPGELRRYWLMRTTWPCSQ